MNWSSRLICAASAHWAIQSAGLVEVDTVLTACRIFVAWPALDTASAARITCTSIATRLARLRNVFCHTRIGDARIWEEPRVMRATWLCCGRR
jgi:hypothetical protein